MWLRDWLWRLFRGDTGLGKQVTGKLENAGYGWYRITLPISEKIGQHDEATDDDALAEKLLPGHPVQSYYLNIPSVNRLQNHAFIAAKVRSNGSGPVFLFQRAQGSSKTKQNKLDKEWTWMVSCQVGENDGLDESVALEVHMEGPYIATTTGFQPADRVVCVVGGTGLTGAYSLALWWLQCRSRDPKVHFTLIWTVRNRARHD